MTNPPKDFPQSPVNTKSRVPDAVGAGALALVWYAMPDVVCSRPARAALKTAALLGAGWIGVRLGRGTDLPTDPAQTAQETQDGTQVRQGTHAPDETQITDETQTPDETQTAQENAERKAPSTGVMVAGAALLGLTVWGSVAIERKIFARGERRRAEGVRGAHSRMAVVAALATLLGALIPDD